MSEKTIGFIGGGRVTRILLEGWSRAQALPANIVVSDCNAESFAKLTTRHPSVRTTKDCPTAAAQDLVFLAVHPPVMAEVAGAIKDVVKPTALVVSLAPKFTFDKLGALLGGFHQKIKP